MALLAKAPAQADRAEPAKDRPDEAANLHPLVTERVLTLALADTRNFAMRWLHRGVGSSADDLCHAMRAEDGLANLIASVQRAGTLLLDALGERQARNFIAAVQDRLAYANPAWRHLLQTPAALQRPPVGVTLV